MPVVEVKAIERALMDARKKDLIRKVTEATASVMGENMRNNVRVVISEVESGRGRMGDNPATAIDVGAMMEGSDLCGR